MALHFKRFGEGPPLVLIHGLFGSLENLGVLSRGLAEHFTVYGIDLPNHGRSPHTDTASLHNFAAQVRQWLSEQNLNRVKIVGHSLGGKVGMELAIQHPDLVEHLAVLDIAPVNYPPHHSDVFAGLLELDPINLKSRSDAEVQLKERVPEAAVRSFLLKNLVKSETGYAWRMNLPVIHRDYSKLIMGNSEGSFSGHVLFMKGGRSSYIQNEHEESIITRFPQASLRVIPDTGHWLHVEKPDLVIRLLRRFLST